MSANSSAITSRVAWGAIFAGSLVAFACFLSTGAVWAAIDFSLPMSMAGFVPAWVMTLSLFAMAAGGWTTARFCDGENIREATLFGVIMWSLTALILLTLGINGTSLLGSSTVLGQLGSEEVFPVSKVAAWWGAISVVGSLIATMIGTRLGFPSAQIRARRALIASELAS